MSEPSVLPFQYHGRAIGLLERTPVVSPGAIGAIVRAEQTFGFRCPPSVREWYSLRDAASILESCSRADSIVPVEELGEPVNTVDLVKQNLLLFRHENQGVCSWTVRLEAGDDPP